MRKFQNVNKYFCALALLGLTLPAPAQTWPGAYVPQPRRDPEPKSAKSRPVGGNIFRSVTGQVFNIHKSVLWRDISGKVEAQSGSYLILNRGDYYQYKIFALKNYSGVATSDQFIRTPAMNTGTYVWREIPLELWDCGTPYVAPAPRRAAPITNSVAVTRTNRTPVKPKR